MIHRNLTANTILVKHDNSPILTGFEHARIPADVSVASPAAGKDWDAAVCSRSSRARAWCCGSSIRHVYSLCASLDGVVRGAERRCRRQGRGSVTSWEWTTIPANRSSLSDLDVFLSDLLGETHTGIRRLRRRGSGRRSKPYPSEARDYRIVSCLGSGGVGTTFKVVEDGSTKPRGDLGTYVAKVARDAGKWGERVLSAYEVGAHSHLRHSAFLSTIFEDCFQSGKTTSFVASDDLGRRVSHLASIPACFHSWQKIYRKARARALAFAMVANGLRGVGGAARQRPSSW